MLHQRSIFPGILDRTTSQIKDARDAWIGVMDAKTQYAEEVKAPTDQDVYSIRGVDRVEWVVPLYNGLGRAKGPDRGFRALIVMGWDDPSLVGAPCGPALGSLDGLRDHDSIIIDRAG
jgi:putative ABC transport system permease protein